MQWWNKPKEKGWYLVWVKIRIIMAQREVRNKLLSFKWSFPLNIVNKESLCEAAYVDIFIITHSFFCQC